MQQKQDFMKTREEKGMPEEEYKAIYNEFDKKADGLSELVKKIIFVFTGVLLISFIIINIVGFAAENLPDFSFVPLVIFKIILALLLYDPKIEDDKKYKYETDQKIILNLLKRKIKANKIRLGGVIAVGTLAAAAHFLCWWFIIDIMREMQ
ncbi:MAG: hypothetical protein FWH24_05685 [Oscillospiraceae bacterium]|nr:hypothetical protein [Oscillospiraceae bacterium]